MLEYMSKFTNKLFKLILSVTLTSGSSQLYAASKLMFATEVFRHGDRTPTFRLPQAYSWPEGMGQLTAKGMQ